MFTEHGNTAFKKYGVKKYRAGAALNEHISGPMQDPGQDHNPNIVLTRPQAFGPLTLVGQLPGGVTQRATPSKINNALPRPRNKVVI